jgi:hypothetical protein
MKSRRIRLAGHVACIGEMRCIQNFGRKNLKGKSHLRDLGVDGRIILKWIIKECGCDGADSIQLAP